MKFRPLLAKLVYDVFEILLADVRRRVLEMERYSMPR